MTVTNSREVVVGERRVTVRELTVGDVRNWLKEVSTDSTISAVDMLLIPEISLPDLTRMTNLSVGDLDAWQPSQLRELMMVAKELNADFFGLRGRLMKIDGVIHGET